MAEQFNVAEYLGYLVHRRWILVVACAVAGALALGFSLMLPKQYTAVASILIDAPTGGDPRAATVVSPMYLESLITYEHFVESDTLFSQALEKFNLRADYPGAATDSLKRRVLKVTKPRDTRILEVSATLQDPAKAQALAQFIAEQTVNLNRTLSRQSDQDFISEAQRQLDVAHAKLEQSEQELKQESGRGSYDALQADVDNLVELRVRLRKELFDSKVDVADYTAQNNQRELASVRARVAAIEKQLADLDTELNAKSKTSSAQHARLEKLGADVKAARALVQAAESRMNDTHWTAGGRSEHLRIIDPGIVPQHPSSPHITLNVVAALFIAAIFGWLYLTLAFALRGQRRGVPARAYSTER